MVAPLYVEVLAGEQIVHDDMCPGASVEDVAQNVKLVDAEPLDDIADGGDEVLGLACLYDGFDDALEVGFLVIVHGILMQQFFYNVGKLPGQSLAYLATGIFAAYGL